MNNIQLPKTYVVRICTSIVMTLIALTMASSIETILQTGISLHRYLMRWVTFAVLGMSAYAVFLCWRASTIDVLYTFRKVMPLVLAIFPLSVFIFQFVLWWIWVL